mgnify:CR=1 FL=1|jgi:hypothetical protein
MGFAADIEAFATGAELKTGLVLRRVMLQGLIGVTRRSPVEFGTFRAAWNIGVNASDTSTPPERTEHSGPNNQDPPTGEELQAAESRMREASWRDTLFLTNAMPYSQVLEDGSSIQTEHMPDGILGVTVDELEADNARLIEEVSRS